MQADLAIAASSAGLTFEPVPPPAPEEVPPPAQEEVEERWTRAPRRADGTREQ